MNELICLNQVLKWHLDEGKEILERVLWINDEGTNAYLIGLSGTKSIPRLYYMEDIQSALENSNAEILENDPFAIYLNEGEIPQNHCHVRDRAWDAISEIVCQEPEIYDRVSRGKYIEQVVKTSGITKKVVYKYLRKFWQRGKNKNALLPDYSNSGGRGKEKIFNGKKIGRPRNSQDIGVAVGPEMRRVFQIAYKEFYNKSNKNPLKTAYEIMLMEYFTEGYKIVDSVRMPILMPPEKRPTITQFKYWIKKEQNFDPNSREREGDKNYELNYRPITGRSDGDLLGPGSVYQIDATIGDVYLVSRDNRNWIIGRPVIYIVIDVFSRMIVGLYVGLEGPSWTGAMMALANVVSDKVKFCTEYGIEISEYDWPCRNLPQVIRADRGEMEGKMPETLINTFGVRIDNTPPYRADLKGIVEQSFRKIN